MRKIKISLLLFVYILSCSPSKKKDISTSSDHSKYEGGDFNLHVRKSEALSPEDEKLGFKLPPGFKIELYASEPEIGKPINMAFDEQGRLWVTQSFEYPFASAPGKGKDRITILEDRNMDGKAETFTQFNDTLDIPIGILPVNDGAIAFSIPNVYKFTDKNNDGRSDESKVLLGPFGYKDTHGMVNNLTRGYDGWVHADHGFTNTSSIAGKDGDTITMNSGNTFRFQPDGSRVEQTTYGRVNPFGMIYDDLGYLYSSDCHSSPIYQLIMGAEYPTFGKNEEGIGFAPAMKPMGNESTALSGLAYYFDNKFPSEYLKNFFLGDVVTCRIYRNSVSYKGSTPIAKREADFLLSKDPWFRPVDVKLGPDGALYVADFYNRIIGHYEVPLNDPGRDRIRGRIWKISYKGVKNEPVQNLRTVNTDNLIAALKADNLVVRMRALDQITDRIGKDAIGSLTNVLNSGKNEKQYALSLWALHRLNALDDNQLSKGLIHSSNFVRIHSLRIVKEKKKPIDAFYPLLKNALTDKNPHMQRAAAEALSNYPSVETLKALLNLSNSIPEFDTHLKYTTRLALRNMLQKENIGSSILAASWTGMETKALFEILPAVKSSYAADFLFNYIEKNKVPQKDLIDLLQHIARYSSDENMRKLVKYTLTEFASDKTIQFKIYSSLSQGLEMQGKKQDDALKNWGISMATDFINKPAEWTFEPLDHSLLKQNPIILHGISDTKKGTVVGITDEGLTGIIRSPYFIIPDSLKFTVPYYKNKYEDDNNPFNLLLRIKLLKDTSKTIGEFHIEKLNSYETPDVKFNLSSYKGEKGYIELIKTKAHVGIIRVGNFQPAVINMPAESPKDIAAKQKFACEMAGINKLSALESAVKACFNNSFIDYFVRIAAARALIQLSADNTILVVKSVQDLSQPFLYRKELISILGEFPNATVIKILENEIKNAPRELQLELVKALVNSSEGKTSILKQVRSGGLYPRILIDPVIEDRLLLNANEKQTDEFKELTANISPVNEEKENLIKLRISNMKLASNPLEAGKPLFTKSCAPCHQINKEGGMIGPQLDGIGNWGLNSLSVKILDPNRNISEAFRNYTIRLKNGKVMVGLFRREEGEVLVFANSGGEEFTVAKNEVAEKKASKFTLMPDHFGRILDQEKFNSLMSFLLSVK